MSTSLHIHPTAASLSVPVCIDAAICRFVQAESRFGGVLGGVRFDQIEEVFAPWPATRADLVALRQRLARLCAAGWLQRRGPALRQRWLPGERPIPPAGPLPVDAATASQVSPVPSPTARKG